MADAVTRHVRSRPVVISFCGTDLFGREGLEPAGTASLRYGVLASRRAAARVADIYAVVTRGSQRT